MIGVIQTWVQKPFTNFRVYHLALSSSDPKTNRVYPQLRGKFHDERWNMHLGMIRKPFTNIRVLWPWPWPLIFWPKNLLGSSLIKRNIGKFHDERCNAHFLTIQKLFSNIRVLWPCFLTQKISREHSWLMARKCMTFNPISTFQKRIMVLKPIIDTHLPRYLPTPWAYINLRAEFCNLANKSGCQMITRESFQILQPKSWYMVLIRRRRIILILVSIA